MSRDFLLNLRVASCFAGLWLAFGTPNLACAQYSIVDLGDLGGEYAQARAINLFGKVAGFALLPDNGGDEHAVMWDTSGVTDLGTLGGGRSRAMDINSSGTVSGWAQTAAGNALPTLWNSSGPTALPTLGGSTGVAWGLNDAGVAVGNSTLMSGGGYHAAIWNAVGVQDLGTLGGVYSTAYDINNGGVVAGAAGDSSGRDHAVIWAAGSPLDLGDLWGGRWTTARQINDSGQVILWGSPLGAVENRAAFWNGDLLSPVVDLGTFGGGESWAYGLNNRGNVVGWAEDQDGTYRAFHWDGSGMTDLGTLGGYYSAAYSINEEGVIAGWSLDATGVPHAVAWVPSAETVPEAETTFVLLSFLLGVLWLNRRQMVQR